MKKLQSLAELINNRYASFLDTVEIAQGELTIEVKAPHLTALCWELRDAEGLKFDTLVDACGVDYADYGVMDWQTDSATTTGFSRGVEQGDEKEHLVKWHKPRFAVVYHLLSTALNQRVRVRVFCPTEPPLIDSVIEIWNSANWYEREAYDLYGILFNGHPDLRRILTDYGFIGHPFRKDFPLSGQVEMRYDAKLGRVVYEPVDIQPRVLVPKVIRADNRYEINESQRTS